MHSWTAYLTAVALTVGTFYGRLALAPWIGDRPILIVFVLPVLACAYWGGTGPGLLAMALASLGIDYFLFPPYHQFAFGRGVDFAQWLAFVICGTLISLMGGALRRHRQNRESSLGGRPRSMERRIQAFFGASLALLIGLGLVSYSSVRDIYRQAEILRQADDLNTRLHRLLTTVNLAETGQRGYVITGEEVFLAPYELAVREIPGQMDTIRAEIGDDEVLQRQFADAARLVHERLEQAQGTITARREQGFAAAQARIATGRGRNLQEGLIRRLEYIRQVIARRLRDHEERASQSVGFATTMIVAAGILAVVIVAAALYVIDRDFAGSRRADAALREARDLLERRVRERTRELDVTLLTLGEREQTLRLFIEHAPAALAMFDRKMRYLTASHRWCEEYGVKEEDLIGRSHYEAFPGIDEAWKQVHRRALAGEIVRSEADRFVRQDGRTQWLRWEVRPWLEASGKVGGIVIFSEDITERQLSAESNARLAAIVESSDDAIVRKTPEGVIEAWNHGAERMFGYTAQEAVGRPMLMVFPKARAGEEREILERLTKGESTAHFESERVRKDGTSLVVSVSVSPVRDGAGRIVAASSVLRDITAWKRVEAALRVSEERLKATFESLTEGIIIVSLEGTLLQWNDAAERILSFPPRGQAPLQRTAFIGRVEIYTPEGVETPPGAWPMARILAGERLRGHEGRYRLRATGEERILSYNGSMVTTSSGVPLAYVAVTDVTARWRAEAQREGERRRVVLLAANSNQLALSETPEQEMASVFQRVAQELAIDIFANYLVDERKGGLRLASSRGLSVEQVATFGRLQFGESLCGLVAAERAPMVLPDLPSCTMPNAAGIIALGVTCYAGFPLMAGTRLIGTISFGARNRSAYTDEELRLMKAVADQVSAVMERTRLIGELRESETRYRTLYDTMLLGVVHHDASGAVTAMNPAATAILGITAVELTGRRAESVEDRTIRENGARFPGEEHPATVALRTGHEVRDVVMGIYNEREGAHRWININAVPQFEDGEAGPTGVYVIFNDITAAKRAQDEVRHLNEVLEERVQARTAELEAANKELESFSYSVSHDLRAPLRAIDGFTQAFIDDYGATLPPQGRHYLERVQTGARRMGELIDDLLALSRLSRQPLNLHVVNSERLMLEAWEELTPARVGREVELIRGRLPDGRGDATLLRQVWINLLGNAIKYTGRRPVARIEVGAEIVAGKTIYFVRDNGAGFDMRYANKLFGVFQRLHRADEFPGTGVGLAIVQRMVHRHGGRVWAEGAVDQGATFRFTLG